MEDSKIPRSLLVTLLELRPPLERDGSVQKRCEPGRSVSWRLRVRSGIPSLGYRKHLSIRIRQEETANAVAALIGKWKAERAVRKRAIKQAVEKRRRAARLERLENREMKLAVMLIAGGSKTRQRKIGTEWEQVCRLGVIPSALWLLSRQYLRPLQKTARSAGNALPAHPEVKEVWEPIPVQEIVQRRFAERRHQRELAPEGAKDS